MGMGLWVCGRVSVCMVCILSCLVFRQAAEQARGRAEHQPSQPRGPREEDPHQADERGEEQPGRCQQQQQGQVLIVFQITFCKLKYIIV